VGDFSIVGGCSKLVQDLPPYSMCDGHPAAIYGLNSLGLRRANFSSSTIGILKKTFKILFFEKHSFSEAKQLVRDKLPSLKEIDCLIEFISSSKRGISKPR
jgi:UDP-N-acetylglucosamine acyltransferase